MSMVTPRSQFVCGSRVLRTILVSIAFFVEEFPIQLGSRASFSISSVSNDAGVSHLHSRSVFIKVEMLISTLLRALTNDEPRTVTWVFNTPT